MRPLADDLVRDADVLVPGKPNRWRHRRKDRPDRAKSCYPTRLEMSALLDFAVRLGAHRRQSPRQHPLIPLVDRVPPVRGKVGRPRRRSDRVTGDRAHDYPSRRRELRRRGIKAEIARRNTEHGPGLGRHRWVVERLSKWTPKLAPYASRGGRSLTELFPGRTTAGRCPAPCRGRFSPRARCCRSR
jgi:hypothetical protein